MDLVPCAKNLGKFYYLGFNYPSFGKPLHLFKYGLFSKFITKMFPKTAVIIIYFFTFIEVISRSLQIAHFNYIISFPNDKQN
jgi:hypothetical protein